MAPNKAGMLLASALLARDGDSVRKHLVLPPLRSAVFLACCLAALGQLVLLGCPLQLLMDTHAGTCWAVAEPFQLLIYTPGQHVTAQ